MRHAYTSPSKLRSLFALSLGLGLSSAAFAQTPISIGSATAIYSQDFDGLTSSGTTYPAGWTGLRAAGSGTANETLPLTVYNVSNSGGVYNAGAVSPLPDTDRALGSLASASTAPAFGAVFTNGTGVAITRVNVAARMEQWRSGNVATVNEITAFEYSLNATGLNSTGATWVAVTSLDLVERNTGSVSADPTDGNDATNSAPISGTITLNWPAGTTMWIRWRDVDNTGNDALMAVDNFAISTGTTSLATRPATNSTAVSVFPNPATDVVSVRINGKATNAAVTVTDLAGRKVLSGNTAADGTFSLRSLPAGSYVVIVKDGTESSAHKVVKR